MAAIPPWLLEFDFRHRETFAYGAKHVAIAFRVDPKRAKKK